MLQLVDVSGEGGRGVRGQDGEDGVQYNTVQFPSSVQTLLKGIMNAKC